MSCRGVLPTFVATSCQTAEVRPAPQFQIRMSAHAPVCLRPCTTSNRHESTVRRVTTWYFADWSCTLTGRTFGFLTQGRIAQSGVTTPLLVMSSFNCLNSALSSPPVTVAHTPFPAPVRISHARDAALTADNSGVAYMVPQPLPLGTHCAHHDEKRSPSRQ
jgi:hypothetical protein